MTNRDDARRLAGLISGAGRKPDPSAAADRWGTVLGVDGNTATVQVDSGEALDAVLLVSAAEGHRVRVRTVDHVPYVLSNATALPTDDAAALAAGQAAAQAMLAAADAARTATDYMAYADGELTIGFTDAEIRNVIRPDSQAYTTDAGDIASYGRKDDIWIMSIDNVEVKDMLRIGGFAFIRRDNGNLTLKWIGE